MKKNLKLISLPLLFASSAACSIASAHENVSFDPGDKSYETKICIAAAENNLLKYKRAIDSLSPRKNRAVLNRVVAEKLKCNGMSVGEFALTNRADKTAQYIAYYTNDVELKRLASRIEPIREEG